MIVAESVKAQYASDSLVARIDRLGSARWWRERSPSVTLTRTLTAYETHLHLLLRHSNLLVFIDPYLDPANWQYHHFGRLLTRAGDRSPAPTIEIHRAIIEDADDRRQIEHRFREVLAGPLRAAGLNAGVFIWSSSTTDSYSATSRAFRCRTASPPRPTRAKSPAGHAWDGRTATTFGESSIATPIGTAFNGASGSREPAEPFPGLRGVAMKTLHNDRAAAVAKPASPSQRIRGRIRSPSIGTRVEIPLIAAIEIENFKGIGRPVRIDLRPITLLFGRNSAGKSTILHALCYAHEILRHRNVDPRRVELGGHQVDLGGFQNLVHGHDVERVVRLRFELNLKNWCVPDQLLEKMAHPALSEYVDPGDAEDHKNWVLKHARGELARTGWVEVHVGIQSGTEPRVTLYEVGVNETLVGRIVPFRSGDELEFNWAHPWFAPLRGGGIGPVAHGRPRIGEWLSRRCWRRTPSRRGDLGIHVRSSVMEREPGR